MYVIIVYDIKVERINRVRKYLKTYLDWVQNSVFEGEVTKAELRRIRKELKEITNEKEDCVLIYVVRLKRYIERELMGIEKGDIDVII